MIIRKAKNKDLKEIGQILKKEFSKSPFNEKANIRSVMNSLSFYFKIGNILVVEIKGNIVGVLVYKKEQYWEGPVFIIEDLAILSNFQKKGLGKALMNKIEAIARIQKINSIYFSTNKKCPSIKFYDKLGYKLSKDEVIMRKKLR